MRMRSETDLQEEMNRLRQMLAGYKAEEGLGLGKDLQG